MKYNLMIQKVLAVEPEIKIPGGRGPDESLQSAYDYVIKVRDIALDVAIIIGIIMVFYSAFLYVSSFGDDSKAETAKKTLLWAAIGTAVVLAAKFIVDTLGNFLSVS